MGCHGFNGCGGMKGLRFSFGKFDNTWLKMGFMTKGWIWRLPPWCLGFAKVYTWRKSVTVYCIYSGVHFSHKWFETHSCFFLFPKLWCFYYIPVMTQRLIVPPIPLQKATAPASIGPRVPHSCPSLMFVLSAPWLTGLLRVVEPLFFYGFRSHCGAMTWVH